ncbi:MAG: DNA adenine methylase [Ruminococcaceae bacterium]|nr:DNA adenine methylase [Oscillospiraceae bacterium]
MNSFINWIGGKMQLRETILKAFPTETPSHYIEVFGGAGWLLFSRDRHAPVEVFNDRDGDLINLYRCVQHHPEELQREMRLGGEQIPPLSRELFATCLAQLAMPGLTDIQRAARYYYVIRASFGAKRTTVSTMPKPALRHNIDRLPEIQRRLQDVVIDNRDFEPVINCYNKPGALFYLDPPYFKTEGYYEGFSREDHLRLCRSLKGIKGKFILSYNDAPEIRQLYDWCHVEGVRRANNLSYGPNATSVYRELLITNYAPPMPNGIR